MKIILRCMNRFELVRSQSPSSEESMHKPLYQGPARGKADRESAIGLRYLRSLLEHKIGSA